MNILIIQGPEKTGTSLVTGILNCHPDIFILFENYLNQIRITKYAAQLFERYPEARQFYRTEKDIGVPIMEFFQFLREKEPDFEYKFVGTKINSLDHTFAQQVKNHKVIYTMRDIKTWLIKETNIPLYRTDLDIVNPSIEYLSYIINTCKSENSFRLRMEDLIKKNEETIESLSSFLQIDLNAYTKDWWKKIGNKDPKDPKSVFHLNRVHHSSRSKPGKLDSNVEIIQQPFWDLVEEIMDKYYWNFNENQINQNSIQSDLEKVSGLRQYSPLSIYDGYCEITSERFGFKKPKEIHYLSKIDKTGRKRNALSIFKKKISYYKRILSRIKVLLFGNRSVDKRLVIGVAFYDELRIVLELIIMINQELYF